MRKILLTTFIMSFTSLTFAAQEQWIQGKMCKLGTTTNGQSTDQVGWACCQNGCTPESSTTGGGCATGGTNSAIDSNPNANYSAGEGCEFLAGGSIRIIRNSLKNTGRR